MRIQFPTRYAALVALAGALACASNKARTDEGTKPDQAGAARDTTQNPPGYRGMERDTSVAPSQQQTPSDTFLQNQGVGTPQDTAGYSGAERIDTTGGAGVGRDTSGMSGMDSSGMRSDTSRTGATGFDSTGTSRSGDTTGYNPSQQSQDTTTSR